MKVLEKIFWQYLCLHSKHGVTCFTVNFLGLAVWGHFKNNEFMQEISSATTDEYLYVTYLKLSKVCNQNYVNYCLDLAIVYILSKEKMPIKLFVI